MPRSFVEVVLCKFGEGKGRREGQGGEEGQQKTPMHELCAFFFFIKAVRFPGIAVAISSQAKLM